MYNKNDIRTEYLEKRLELSSEQVLQKSQKICAQFKDLEELENARMIAFYLPIKNEVDTKQLIDDFIESGADICVPCFGSNKQNYSFCQFVAWDNLEPGPYGILQPKIARQVRVEQVDVVA
ncbi:hypothetical protein HY024_04405, partial [Candidatus Curtissbacteria bacterium]|nr:hypothetical protein [Candidatus Curtissbacteria bacterium]